MAQQEIDQKKLLQVVFSRFLMALVVLMLMFFGTAGSFGFWQAWVYLLILVFPMLFTVTYLIKKSPELLARRMHFKEKEAQQSLIIKLSFLPFLLAFILPGLDYRWGWSTVPLWMVLLSDGLVLAGYGLVILVFRENQYASRVVEVSETQQVISSGPYSQVRHPMYVGMLLLYLFSPLALASWWAVLPALLIIPVIIFRILNEEKVLVRDLPGYADYLQKVRYRLIPGIW